MAHPPKVFISATSGDLATAREAIKQALLTMGCHPVEQANFPPDYRTVREMLREKIADCQAVIHVVGMCYGAEPDPEKLPPNTPRRSYTQIEYDLAVELNKKLYSFVCPPDFPYDSAGDAEDGTKRQLQEAHRQRVQGEERHYAPVADRAALAMRIRELQIELQALKREVDRHKRGTLVAAMLVVAALAAIGGGTWWSFQRLHSDMQQVNAVTTEKIRAHLLQTIDATHERELAEAKTNADWRERNRLREGAEAAHAARLERVNELVASFAEIEATGTATSVFEEMTRVLSEQGVDEAISYVESQRDSILRSVAAREKATKKWIRLELQPLLKIATLQESQGRSEMARNNYETILSKEPDWPDAIHTYLWFLVNRGDAARHYLTIADALTEYETAQRMAERLNAIAPNNPEFERDLATTHYRLGDIALAQGNLAEAKRKYSDCVAIAEKLADGEPANPKFQYDLSVSYSALADVASAQDDAKQAARQYGAAFEIAKKWVTVDKSRSEWQQLLAAICSKRGDLALGQHDLTEAKRNYVDGAKVAKTLVDGEESNIGRQRVLSVFYNKLGDVAQLQGDPIEAAGNYSSSFELRKSLAASDPANADWQRDLAISYYKLGEIAFAQSQLPEAAQSYSDGLAISTKLAESDPANAERQRDLSIAYDQLGNIAALQWNLEEAARRYGDGLEIAKKLADSDTSNIGWQRDVATSYYKLVNIAVAQDKLEDANRYCNEGLKIAEDLARGAPANADSQRDLAYSHFRLSQILAKQRQWSAALEHANASLRVDEVLASQNPDDASRQSSVTASREWLEQLRRDSAGAKP